MAVSLHVDKSSVNSHSSTIIPVSVLIVLVVGVGGVELKNLTSARWTH